ncbi:MAG: calcium/sodium antiporter [Cyclobacteriaceae bacterium]|nr:calcium/sodium antiporter [Cyclobacteriaceae bacterium]MCH8514980.1 calcium/sodium antiporter [Cyclobacteriaceae bacterium]
MWQIILLIIIGFVLLIAGASTLVNGATDLARKYGVSDLIIGLTIVAFATSAPELFVNLLASSKGHSEIVLANVIGSNNFNLFIILGIAGLIYPIKVQSSTAWKEIPFSILITIAVIVLLMLSPISRTSELGRTDGILLLIAFGGFLCYLFRQMKQEEAPSSAVSSRSNWMIAAFIFGGLLGLVGGGHLVVTYSIELAQLLGISEKVIGLTIVAAGTSLPELVTSVVAALKKSADIAIGNVIGSNIFNLLLVLASSSIIRPIAYEENFLPDLLVLLGGSIFLLLAMWTGKHKTLDRWEAGLLFLFYIAFMVYSASSSM